MAYHIDLYRIADSEELEFLGIRDYLSPKTFLFVEWPERGEGVVPVADVHIRIKYEGSGRSVNIERGEGARNYWLQQLSG